jgi:hypothetical protein
MLHGAEGDGAVAAWAQPTPLGTGTVWRTGMRTYCAATPSRWKPMMPPSAMFSQRFSCPRRQGPQWPQNIPA